MANKFKNGDWVEVIDTPNVRYYDPSGKGIGMRFKITQKCIERDVNKIVYLPYDNKYSTNYLSSDLKLITKKQAMATKKKATTSAKEDVKLTGGQYFTAMYKKTPRTPAVKIRGIVKISEGWSTPDRVYLCNKGHGEETEDCGGDTRQFSHFIDVSPVNDGEYSAGLKSARVTDFKVCNDKRQKAIINSDVMPDIMNYKVIKRDEDTFVFGCGAVELTRKQIEGYLEFRKWVESKPVQKIRSKHDEVCENAEIVDLSTEEVENYLRYKKLLESESVKAKKKIYDEVVEVVEYSNASHDEDDLLSRIDIEEIEALLKN